MSGRGMDARRVCNAGVGREETEGEGASGLAGCGGGE